jgi:hypothetical protein
MQTIDTQGNVISVGDVEQVFNNAATATTIFSIARSLEINAEIRTEQDQQGNDCFKVVLHDPTPEQIGLLERKTAITTWSATTSAVANSVTNAVTQVGDYALNGALAPTAVAVANAAFTTGRVVGTAATRVAAGTVASLAFNGRVAFKEVANSKEVHSCISEVKQCFTDAGKGLASLFGVNTAGLGNWTQVQAPQAQAVAP